MVIIYYVISIPVLDGKFDEFKPKKLVTTVVPSIGWLGHYKWKSDLVPDLISGVTVAIMHIPQGKLILYYRYILHSHRFVEANWTKVIWSLHIGHYNRFSFNCINQTNKINIFK